MRRVILYDRSGPVQADARDDGATPVSSRSFGKPWWQVAPAGVAARLVAGDDVGVRGGCSGRVHFARHCVAGHRAAGGVASRNLPDEDLAPDHVSTMAQSLTVPVRNIAVRSLSVLLEIVLLRTSPCSCMRFPTEFPQKTLSSMSPATRKKLDNGVGGYRDGVARALELHRAR